jgi:hypothetical protein
MGAIELGIDAFYGVLTYDQRGKRSKICGLIIVIYFV